MGGWVGGWEDGVPSVEVVHALGNVQRDGEEVVGS